MDTHEFMISQSSYRQSYLAIQFLSHSNSPKKSLMDMDNKQKVINIWKIHVLFKVFYTDGSGGSWVLKWRMQHTNCIGLGIPAD